MINVQINNVEGKCVIYTINAQLEVLILFTVYILLFNLNHPKQKAAILNIRELEDFHDLYKQDRQYATLRHI